MNGWPQHKLGEFIDITHGYAFKSKYFTDAETGIIVMTPGNFAIGGGFKNDKPKWYDTNGPRPPDYVLSPGDLLITMTDLSRNSDTLGYGAIVPRDEFVYLHNQRIGLVKIRQPAKVDKAYLYYLMHDDGYRQQIIATASGTTVHHTSPSRIKDATFRLPPLPTQRRIAQILGRLDDKIEVNRRINRTLEVMAQALFKHWFVDSGPFQAGPFVESELGLIPEGWGCGRVEDVTELVYGKGLPEKQRVSGKYPVFGSSGQVGTHNKYLVEAPGIIVGRKGTIGKLSWARDHFWPIDTTYYVVPRSEVYSFEYIYHLLDSLALESRNTDSAVPGLNRSETYRLPVIIPPDDVLKSFSSTAKPWYKQIDMSNREISILTATRDYLLPRLLSGEVAV